MPVEKIESRQNPRIKTLVKLRERKYRDALGLYCIEGVRETSRAQRSPAIRLQELYICPSLFRTAATQAIIDRAKTQGTAIFEVAPLAFERACYREGPDGILAVAATELPALSTLHIGDQALLLVVEGIEKPGNLGALLRSADSVGADALICCDLELDVFNPNVIRASQGAFFSVPTYLASPQATCQFLCCHAIQVLTTTPQASTVYWDADFTQPSAIVMGNEHTGLTKTWLEAQHTPICIPQRGCSDSLNVAAAATLVLYEALRQRSQ